MSPETGTFISMDSYAGSLDNPVSLHKYLYANANPVMYMDPSGYFSLSESMTATTINAVLGSPICATLATIIAGISITTTTYIITSQIEILLSNLTYICDMIKSTADGKNIEELEYELVNELYDENIKFILNNLYVSSGQLVESVIKVVLARNKGGNNKSNEKANNKNADGSSESTTSQNQMQQKVKKGQAPKEVDRVDPPHTDGGKPHIHFRDDEAALNIDGTWHDEGLKRIPKLTNKIIKWILENGWKLPND